MGGTSSKVNQFHRDASKGFHQSVAVFLCDEAIDINSIDNGSTALHKACDGGHLETVDVLLTFEGTPALDINLSDDKGRTALHLAVAGNHAPIVTRLCNDNRLDVNVGDQFGETALHDACAKQNRSDIVHQLIVARGVDVNIKSKAGITPLHKAVGENLTATAELLLRAPGIDTACKDKAGDTPLHEAASRKGYAAMIALLLRGGGGVGNGGGGKSGGVVDVNARAVDGSTALMRACEKGRTGNVAALLASPLVDANAQDECGETALMLAVRNLHAETAEALLTVPGLKVGGELQTHDGGHSALDMAQQLAKDHGIVEATANPLKLEEEGHPTGSGLSPEKALLLRLLRRTVEAAEAKMAALKAPHADEMLALGRKKCVNEAAFGLNNPETMRERVFGFVDDVAKEFTDGRGELDAAMHYQTVGAAPLNMDRNPNSRAAEATAPVVAILAPAGSPPSSFFGSCLGETDAPGYGPPPK